MTMHEMACLLYQIAFLPLKKQNVSSIYLIQRVKQNTSHMSSYGFFLCWRQLLCMAYDMAFMVNFVKNMSSVFFVFQNSDPDAMLFRSTLGSYNLFCAG